MKIKQDPADFQVDELTEIVPSSGQFSLYLLQKTGWTTNDAIDRIARAWRLPRQRISFGGLKDRHAKTAQHVTILHGPERDFAMPGIELRFLGKTPAPFTSGSIHSNRFQIVIRDLRRSEAELAMHEIEQVRRDGLANYFDDQRFGSIESGGDFMARRLVLGDWEGGLKLALTAPYEHDRAAAKQEKAIVRKHWGNWAECARKLTRGPTRRVIEQLVARPGDFRNAITHMRGELASLYLAAYQSHLWNNLLARWLKCNLPPENRVSIKLKLADVPIPVGLSAEQLAYLSRLNLPLPSARLKYSDEIKNTPTDWPELLSDVLDQEGIELEKMKLQGLRTPFFSRGERAIHCRPQNLSAETDADDCHAGRIAMALHFNLPRGSYATLLIKRVTRHVPG